MSSYYEALSPLFERAAAQHVEHKVKAASATVTDRGTFEALVAAWTVDRGGDRIQPGAFAGSIASWRAAAKPVPLHWDHKSDPQFVIGRIDDMRETAEGLWVKGQLDLQGSEVAREAWRAMRSGAIGASFGYLTKKSHHEGDVHVLDELDLFEVSLTPAPMNSDTRVLSMKSTPRREPSRIASFDA